MRVTDPPPTRLRHPTQRPPGGARPRLPQRAAARLVRLVAPAVASVLVVACRPAESATMTAAQRAAVADTLRRLMVAAGDLSKPNVVASLMSLYPDSGRVVSASAGQVVTTRDSLEAGIRAFWENVGHNMRDPRWTWGPMHVDVLGPDAAVLTATYAITHRTPRGDPHVVGGAWTAVFARRGGRWAIVQEHLSDRP